MGKTSEKPVSIINWILTYILMGIPLVNIIMLLVWAFGGNTSKSKSNWAAAILIMMLLSAAIYILLFVVLGFSIGMIAGESGPPAIFMGK
ncbi:MAG: hypothetical protein ACIAQZ_03790 [Sedimentisphaeraceae bacterium JB056]